jgi:pectate lyase
MALAEPKRTRALPSRVHGLMILGSIAGIAACSDTPQAREISGQVSGSVKPGQAPAFPGAQGYGANATGGRGGRVLHVTTLADSGPGSLRDAIAQTGPRIVIFDLAGSIRLSSQLLVTSGDLTIAGQTAPGEGITIEGSRMRLKAGNIIIRGLHFRPGDGAGTDPGDRDGMMIGTNDFRIENIMIDHNSFTWAIDENLTINGNVHKVTLSNNIVGEGLSHSLHPKGEHSKGLLVSNWASDDPGGDSEISIIGNLFAANSQRNPEVRAGQKIEIINNLSYNYGLSHTVIWVGGGSKGTLKTSANIIGNVMKPGPSSPNHKVPIAIAEMAEGSRIFLKDNFWTKLPRARSAAQDQTKLYWDAGGARYVVNSPDFGSGATILASGEVIAHVLANAGTARFSRNRVDARILRDAGAGTGRIIDSPAQVGEVANAAAPFRDTAKDSDGDGMPDWFEDRYGLDRKSDDSRGDLSRNGYTNIEEYLNLLMSGANGRPTPNR